MYSGVYIFVASVAQLGWLHAARNIHLSNLKLAFKLDSGAGFLYRLKLASPVLFYLILGIINVACLTLAMKDMPSGWVYAIWTGMVVFWAVLFDRFILKKRQSVRKWLFLALVILGTVGLNILGRP
jgi:quaternary ammonium compound-resistance protein SugE